MSDIKKKCAKCHKCLVHCSCKAVTAYADAYNFVNYTGLELKAEAGQEPFAQISLDKSAYLKDVGQTGTGLKICRAGLYTISFHVVYSKQNEVHGNNNYMTFYIAGKGGIDTAPLCQSATSFNDVADLSVVHSVDKTFLCCLDCGEELKLMVKAQSDDAGLRLWIPEKGAYMSAVLVSEECKTEAASCDCTA